MHEKNPPAVTTSGFGAAGIASGTIGGGATRIEMPPAAPLLDVTRESLEVALKQLVGLIDDVRIFNDSVQGSQPSGVSGNNKGPEANSRGDAIRQRLDGLHDLLGMLRGEVNRLRAI